MSAWELMWGGRGWGGEAEKGWLSMPPATHCMSGEGFR